MEEKDVKMEEQITEDEILEEDDLNAENTAEVQNQEEIIEEIKDDAEIIKENIDDALVIDAPPKEKGSSWGDKAVTGKILAMLLGCTLLLNAALTAGIMALFSNKIAKSTAEASAGGRSRSEMYFDGNPGQRPDRGPGFGMQNNAESGQQASGVSIGIVIREDSGVYVSQITGDNAKKAGFAEGDKIVTADGKSISSSSDLISVVQSHKAGDTLSVTVERDSKTVEIKTVLE